MIMTLEVGLICGSSSRGEMDKSTKNMSKDETTSRDDTRRRRKE